MSEIRLPALSLAAPPGRRRAIVDLAVEIERRGYPGVYCPSFGDAMGLCEALALLTERIAFGTSIANIYTRHASEYATTASLIHELSGGRFRFGVGVSHAPMNRRLGVEIGSPLGDMRAFAEALGAARQAGEQPPLVLAALRKKMVTLAGEIAAGVVFANVARSHMSESLAQLSATQRESDDFFIGNMIPVCISDDRAAAMERNRRTLVMYFGFPNYRRYWKEAGYVDEMNAVEKALEKGERDTLTDLMTDRWLADVTLFGSVAEVLEGLEAWFDAGVKTPILVPSSATGNQLKAFEELFAAFE